MACNMSCRGGFLKLLAKLLCSMHVISKLLGSGSLFSLLFMMVLNGWYQYSSTLSSGW